MDFRVGDIVEVMLAFVVVPTGSKKRRLMLALRGITNMDKKYRMVRSPSNSQINNAE